MSYNKNTIIFGNLDVKGLDIETVQKQMQETYERFFGPLK